MPQTNSVAMATIDLVYVSDDEPGYTRRKQGRGFSYLHPNGARVKDKSSRSRFAALAIPPAWTDVWICLEPNGHMQATGRDDAERKQYIYHPQWEEMRNRAKFARLYEFGQALPKIREQVDADLRKHNLPREKVLALTVALLDETYMRIGNNCYTEQNDSYGLTTLQNKHVEANSTRVSFEFTGKSGVEREIDLRNPRLARLVKACQELPGQHLFQYEDEEGEVKAIESGDVNAYLREFAGDDFSAKDFRTWAGTVAAIDVLMDTSVADEDEAASEDKDDERYPEKNIVAAVKEVAALLGNTPAVCRKYYIHPAILDGYLSGELNKIYQRVIKKQKEGEEISETVALSLLQQMGYGD